MRLYKYFDYAQYVREQVRANKRKLEKIWVREKNVKLMCKFLKSKVPSPVFGLCHGTRNGAEQKWFKKYLGDCDVLGTEISDTAEDFENTIRWDFHNRNLAWVGKADFVYSNSWDQACHPRKALKVWFEQLKPGGFLFLEWTPNHATSDIVDPFGASLEEYEDLVGEFGRHVRTLKAYRSGWHKLIKCYIVVGGLK